MRLRILYSLAGLAWGLVLGPLVGLWVGAMAAGVSWLLLFGDDPWPESVGWIIPLIASAAAVGLAAACTAAGYAYGGARERTSASAGARLKAYGLIGLAGIAGIAAVGTGLDTQRQQDRAREAGRTQTSSFEALVAARHVILDIRVSDDGATIGVFGNRGGSHRLRWLIREQAYRKTLADGVVSVELVPGSGTIKVAFGRLADLKRRYAEKVLSNRNASVLVEEDFVFEATLDPVLSETEFSNIPQAEAQNLAIGQSRLSDTRSAKFPVRFTIP